jgi:hypothetical protein
MCGVTQYTFMAWFSVKKVQMAWDLVTYRGNCTFLPLPVTSREFLVLII